MSHASPITGPSRLQSQILRIVRSDERDLSLRQLAVLLICHTTGMAHTVRGLAEILGVQKPAISRAVDRLEELGLVLRESDPFDGRSIFVTETDQGAALCDRISTI